MGDTRARSKGPGGAALPLTRRQQKRARQRAPQPAQRVSTSPKPRGVPPVAPPEPALPAKKAPEKLAARPSPVDKPAPATALSRGTAVAKARTLADAIERLPTAQARRPARTLRPPRPARARLTMTLPPEVGEVAENATPPTALGAEPVIEAEVVVSEEDSAPDYATETATQSTQTRKYPTLAKIAVAPRPARAEARQDDSDAARTRPDQRETSATEQDIQPSPAPVNAGPSDKREGEDVETRPLRARRPVVTRRLQATRDDAAITSLREQAHGAEPREDVATGYHSRSRPQPMDEVDLTLPVAGAHATVAAVAALAGATLLVQGSSDAIWPLTLTAIAGVGGWLAYMLSQEQQSRRLAGAVLTLSQVGVVVWLMLLIGPRGSLIALAPAIALLALRMSGLVAAVAGCALALGAYLTLTLLALGQRIQPIARLSQTPGVLVDVLIVGISVSVSLLALNLWRRQHAHLDQQARARLREARALRTQNTQDRRRIDDDLRLLEDALVEALRGQGGQALRVGPELESLAERVVVVAERLRTLQQDREDRLRVEGALRGLIREVERAWLSLPWAWPAPSGTTLDELIALLRAPRSLAAPQSWPEETPTLVPIPSTISQPSRPWDVVSQSDFARNSRPRDALYSQLPLGLDESDGSRAIPTYASQLPWREWDMWRDWDPNQSHVVGE